jgi:O-methyltransferase involved in polyketide biosynthesis
MWPAEDVAFLRTYSGIEYAQEIAAASGIRPLPGWSRRETERKLRAAPRIELRLRSVTEVLSRFRHRGIKQVLELAAGLSPRGLILTARDPELVYVETDLPEQLAIKQKCVESILSGNGTRPNLRFLPLDLLDDSQITTLVAEMQGPILVVSEGIRPLMTLVAPKIHKLLTASGGVWITPDLVTGREPRRRFRRRAQRRFAFENEAAIESLLSEAGFRSERFRQMDLIPLEELASLHNPQLNLDFEQQEAWLTGRGVYCLYPL